MKDDLILWRCQCGEKNLPDDLDCKRCRKQRWEQLGITREQAELVVDALFPAL